MNLSNRKLSQSEILILENGLKFTPTPQKGNTEEIQEDLNQFCRKLRLSEFFLDISDEDESLVRNKSNFTPKPGRNKALDKFIDTVTKFPLNNLKSVQKKNNIDDTQRKSINELKNDKNVVIKEADKGSAVVIMNSSHYKDMVLKILDDPNYYEKCPTYSTTNILSKLNKLINKYGNGLTDKERNYITDFVCRESNFYGLPKVHKSQLIEKACLENNSTCVEIKEPDDLKLRPIVAGPCCETHRLSNFLDIVLKPLVTKVKSYIKDTTDFLNYLPQTTDRETILVSFDVTNLYSNIDHDLGVEAIKYWLDNFPECIPDRIEKKFIIESVKFVLENNFFYFDKTHYRQIKGTAMGTKVAPTYATLVLGYLEILLYEKVEENFGNEFRIYIENNWKRFLDDCFILWTKNEDYLKSFHEILNNLHTDISFTVESSPEELPFLDVKVICENGEISTDLYYKPTDTKQYLMYNSCHPKHTKNNIPYNLARRVCSIVSNINHREQRLEELKRFLINRKYPINLIDIGIAKAKTLSKEQLRNKQQQETPEVIPFISTFNPKNPEVFTMIHSNLTILQTDTRMDRIIRQSKIIKSKRQHKNLKKLLTKAKYEETITEEPTVKKCGRPNCGTCEYIVEGNTFKFKNEMKFIIKYDMDCSITNVIYVITCNGCNENYIGQTNNLRKRVTVHRQHIRQREYAMIPLSGHIRSCAQDKKPLFYIFPFYKFFHEPTESERIIKEKRFIDIFKPKLNAI